MVFRFPLAEFSGGLLLADKEESCVCVFWQLFLLEPSKRLGELESHVHKDSLYNPLRLLSERTDCLSRWSSSGSEAKWSRVVRSPDSGS